jgi:AraC family transcriptional regulator
MDDAKPDLTSPVGPLERARLWLDSALEAGPPVTDLARIAGLSTYHFIRQFSARYGASPMAYGRARRLEAAAHRLRAPDPPRLIDLAFDTGFDTQEGFTRAFQRAFGVTPGRYRRTKSLMTPETVMPSTPVNLVQASAPQVLGPVRIAGLAEDFTEASKAGIPALWGRLFAQPGAAFYTSGRTFGVCRASAQEGCDLRYLAGVDLPQAAPVPEGLEVIELPARPYAVFTMQVEGGDLHPQMQTAARAIWGDLLPASGLKLAQAPDLEVYPAGFDPSRAGGELEWWIPVLA